MESILFLVPGEGKLFVFSVTGKIFTVSCTLMNPNCSTEFGSSVCSPFNSLYTCHSDVAISCRSVIFRLIVAVRPWQISSTCGSPSLLVFTRSRSFTVSMPTNTVS